MALQSLVGQGLLIRGYAITLRHTTLGKALWTYNQHDTKTLPENTQHSQETDIHARGGIQTHDLSKQAAAHPRSRPCGHRDRLNPSNTQSYYVQYK
jgi:hypothetical protein